METFRFTFLLLPVFLTFLLSLSAQLTGDFKCSGSNSTCRSLVGYSSKNATTLGNIQTLFSVKHLRSILEANNLPLSTRRDKRVNPNEVIRIPITCFCSNGTGVSNNLPVYTVKPGDNLSFIASEVFGGLVRYQKITVMNNITNPDEIDVGQEFWIPLPCSCDGEDVVHYAHVVKLGSSLGEIAALFGTDNTTLARLNGISGDAQLLADYPLNVPLKACSSSVRNDSLDAPLLLPNTSYFITANDCIKCSCEASKNWTLTCEPSQFKPSTWQTCPSSRCEGAENLLLSNTTTTSCGPRSCAYAGFSTQSIFTTLSPDSCPDSDGRGNYASTFKSSFSFTMVLVQCALLCLCLL